MRRVTVLAPAVAVCVFMLVLVRAAAGGTAVAIDNQAAAPGNSTDADLKAALMDEGQAVYGTNCSECHADGGAGPTLVGDTSLAKTDTVIKQILQGSTNGDMSEFASTLTDRQIAAVGTFIRNSWENAFGIVLEPDVKRLREETATKK